MHIEYILNVNVKNYSDKTDNFLIDGSLPNEARILEAIRMIPSKDLLLFLKEYSIANGNKSQNGPSEIKFDLNLEQMINKKN